MEEEADVEDAIADEQLLSSDAAQAQQYWADDMDEWLGDQSEEILQQPDIEDAFEADDVSAKSATLDNSQPIDDQAIDSDPISLSDAGVETQVEKINNRPTRSIRHSSRS